MAPKAGRSSPRKLESGRRVIVQYHDEMDRWHERVVLCRGSEESLRQTTGARPQGGTDSIWWVLTPDGDVYPEDLCEGKDICALLIGTDDDEFGSLRIAGKLPPVTWRHGFSTD